MLAEAFAWLTTPASWQARRSGYLRESLAIIARERRCRVAWAPHLAASRRALLAAAQKCRSRRIALVLGSGPLLDIPLGELASIFQEVWLVDMVHPRPARRQARRYPQVRLIEHDLTECLGESPDHPPVPTRFLDEPRIDWVASVNLLSQLARLPLRQVARGHPDWGQAQMDAYGAELMHRHLDYLGRFAAATCLLADLEQCVEGGEARLERVDFRPLLQAWRQDAEWEWELAPTGELGGGRSSRHRVGAFSSSPKADSAGP